MAPNTQVFQPSNADTNVFLQSLTGQRGEQLDKYFDTMLPVYEQERYERRIIQLRMAGTGAGNPGIFAFNPPALVGSFVVRQVHVLGELATGRTWSLNHNRRLQDDTGYTVQKASVLVPSGNFMGVLVNDGGAVTRGQADNQITNIVSSPFTCWRNIKDKDDRGESFDVRVPNITPGNAVAVYVELERVPPAASVDDLSSLAVIAT